MKKTLGIAALVAVLAVGGVIYYVVTNLDSIVEDAIEKYGSQTLGTRVRVGSVRISLADGKGTIRGLRVANPQGFSSGDAFRLGEITVQIDAGSVTGSPIVVPQVVILAPEVNFLMSATGGSNIDAILDNAKSGRGGGEAEPVGGEEGGAAPRIAIGSFVFEEGEISADLEAVGGEEMTTDLPPVRLKNIGGSRGATPDEISKRVATAFLGSVTKAVARSQAGALIEKKLGTGAAGEAAKQLLRGVLD